MAKFKRLRQCLADKGLAQEQQFHQPLPCPRRWLELVHTRSYHQAFARGELDRQAQRRIGLPATQPLVRPRKLDSSHPRKTASSQIAGASATTTSTPSLPPTATA